MPKSDIGSLKSARKSLNKKITLFQAYLQTTLQKVENEPEDKDILILELHKRFVQFEAIMPQFDDVQSQLEQLLSDEEFQRDDYREIFENSYYPTLARAELFLQQHTNAKQTVIPETIQPTIQHSTVKLPKIELPKFNGDITDWLHFRDKFISLIHENQNLSNIERFHYLSSSLVDEAAKVIDAIDITDANYSGAWTSVCQRYNNMNLLIHSHIKAIFDLPQVFKRNAMQLRMLSDGLCKHLRVLFKLDLSIQQLFDAMITYIVKSKLDLKTKNDWQEEQRNFSGEIADLEQLKIFLHRKCVDLETLEGEDPKSTKASICINKPKVKTAGLVTTSFKNCFYCKMEHPIFQCQRFIQLPIDARIQYLKKTKRCTNCFRYGHLINQCTASSCRKCGKKHHTLLHNEANLNPQTNESNTEKPEISALTTMSSTNQSSVLLATAILNIVDHQGNIHRCRALLDNGSQSNLITRDLAAKIKLKESPADISLSGIGNTPQQVQTKCNINIRSQACQFQLNLSCLIIDQICEEIPQINIPTQGLKLPRNITLADSTFNRPGKIDLLIGSQFFWKLLNGKQIQIQDSGLWLVGTKLGWILSGSFTSIQKSKAQCNLVLNEPIQRQLERFWEIENVNQQNQREDDCEQHFKQHTMRDETGKFVVRIPLKNSPDVLGDSKEQAKRRFLNVERRLQRNDHLKQQYISFMREYQQLNHMTEVHNSSLHEYFLPHHGVVNDNSPTTKLRVVFDGSAKSSSGFSINDIQQIGPTIQSDIVSILLRFRIHTYAVCADVQKMYRQVLVNKNDRHLQKILWRENAKDPIKTYELNTVTYGTAAAPYLAIRTLKEIGNISQDSNPRAAGIIKNDFYVDDLVTGFDSIADAIETCKQIKDILASAHFPLHKWTSNNLEVQYHIQQRSPKNEIRHLSGTETSRTLGLTWNWRQDMFMYNIQDFKLSSPTTKRSILSTISKIFDPLGLLSPIVVQAKVIMQSLWKEKSDWDEEVSPHLQTQWNNFCNNFSTDVELTIPRRVVLKKCDSIELFGFADASQQAYGACIYVKTINAEEISVKLLCAKSRIAPIKPLTIPKLELCAALLLAKLSKKVVDSLNINISRCVLWTDSSIVLAWIKTPPTSLKPFVKNRVSEIQLVTENYEWKHVPTSSNPADILSRGASPKKLKSLNLWWHGPSWIRLSEKNWPTTFTHQINTGDLPEVKPTVLVTTSKNSLHIPIDVTRFSNYNRLIRAFAYVLRFISNLRKEKDIRQYGSLTPNELQRSVILLLKCIQHENFADELHQIRKHGYVSRKNQLSSLLPFIDQDGILRVGGRLNQADFSYDKKHPMILPKDHEFTKLVLVNEHLRLGHAGPDLILSSIRTRFWPISGRKLAKRIFSKCVRCFRVNPHLASVRMGDLPKVRLQQAPPFFNVGIDYAGPIHIKNKDGRGSRTIKSYICIFVCMSTRAIHLELTTSLSTESFLATFRRFTARRGNPGNVYTDNGTNFIGARNELKDLGHFLQHNHDIISDRTAANNTTWHFIPPRAPHFGGIWEAGVKSVKTHLKRILANALLTYEMLYTTLVQIEAILNSRPLCPITDNPSNLEALTPAHMLINRSLTAPAEHNYIDLPINRLNKFQYIQRLSQDFWTKWHRDYLSHLQTRTKWIHDSKPVLKNQLVVIKDDNTAPLTWQLGRIEEIHPGSDGKARVVTIRTTRGLLKRPVVKICILPLEN